MSFCCSTVQWFSSDRMTGYTEVWNGPKKKKKKVKLNLMALEHNQTVKEAPYFEGVLLDGLDDVSEEHSGR